MTIYCSSFARFLSSIPPFVNAPDFAMFDHMAFYSTIYYSYELSLPLLFPFSPETRPGDLLMVDDKILSMNYSLSEFAAAELTELKLKMSCWGVIWGDSTDTDWDFWEKAYDCVPKMSDCVIPKGSGGSFESIESPSISYAIALFLWAGLLLTFAIICDVNDFLEPYLIVFYLEEPFFKLGDDWPNASIIAPPSSNVWSSSEFESAFIEE